MRRTMLMLTLVVAVFGLAHGAEDAQLRQLIQQQMQVRDQFLRAAEAKRITQWVQPTPFLWDDFDVTYYRIQLDLDFPHRSLVGHVQVGLRVLQDGLSHVGLDFVAPEIQVDSVGMAAVAHWLSNDSLYLRLDRPYAAGETLRVAIAYHGRPRAHDNFPVLFWSSVAGEPAVFSDNEPYYARCWFPCRDYPADKADSVDMIVRVPEPLVVASNGVLRSVTDHGDGTLTYHWHEGYPITTYLISMQVAAYRKITDTYVSASSDSMPVIHFVYPQSYSAGQVDFAVTVPQIAFFSQIWAEYPFVREKYGHAQYGGAWGGMENQTITSVSAGAIRGNRGADLLIAHELAHQWWGDWISPTEFGHVWLNEGFATFAEALWLEHEYGPEGYRLHMESTLNQALRQGAPIFRYPGEPVIVGVVYDKGASVLHMLRRMVGDSVFFAILRDYGQRFAYRTATTEDFQQVCEEHTGKDLGWFFHQWIYEPGHPVLRWAWSSAPAGEGRYLLSGFVDQVQKVGPEVYRLPLELEIETTAGKRTELIWIDSSSVDFSFLMDSQPVDVTVDPRRNLLAEFEQVTRPSFGLLDSNFTDAQGDGDGLWEPGETLELWVTIANEGVAAENVIAELQAEGQDLTVEQGSWSVGQLAHNGMATNRTEPFRVTAAREAEDRLAVLWLRVRAGEVEQRFRILVPLGMARVLFVDDDGGAGTERYYRQAFLQGAVYAHEWDVATNPLADTVAEKYPILIWSTGNAREETLTRQEQQIIRDHLAKGGGVLVAGSNIGYDLVLRGDPEDSSFYREVLRAELLSDSTQFTRLIGKPGDPIGNRLFVYFEGAHGSPEPTSPDAVAPLDPAVGFLFYAGAADQYGAIRWYDPETGGRLVYLTFGLESVRGPYEDTAGELVRRCLDWLMNPTGVETETGAPVPEQLALYPNYPNPFNPGTTIRFELPRPGRVSISVYNLLGQRVRVLRDGMMPAGSHLIRWDGRDDGGRDLPSGIYFLELRAADRVLRQKAVKLR